MFNVPFLNRHCKQKKHEPLLTGKHKIFLIGLGNPGEKYEKTHHNAGRLFVDYIAKELLGDGKGSITPWRNEGLFSWVRADKITLVKTNVFMNQSGRAVQAALSRLGAKPEEALIAHDDADIALGAYKLSSAKGAAGHKGIQSIIQNIGKDNLIRLRIGTRKRKGRAEDFVLKKISKDDLAVLEKTFEEIKRSWIT